MRNLIFLLLFTIGINAQDSTVVKIIVNGRVFNAVGTGEGGGAGTDDQTAAEVSYNNATSGAAATDLQALGDELYSRGTDLGYTASATNGIVTNDRGVDATIPLADDTNAGLLSPVEHAIVNKAVTTDATLVTNGVAINQIVAAPLEDIEALGSPDPNTLYFPNNAVAYAYPQITLSDLSTTLTTGTKKGMWIAPAAGTIESPANNGIMVTLDVPGTSTGINIDINKNGSDIATTNLTTDATEASSDTAATDFALSSYTFVRGDKFLFDIDAVPTGATGALLTMKVIYD